MGLDFLKWKISQERILRRSNAFLDIPILEQLCWTCAGTIDYRKTAERLVKLEILSIPNRYNLACLYCLVDYIEGLWKQLPKRYQINFCSRKYSLQFNYVDMECYWAFILNEEDSEVDRIFGNELLFKWCQEASFKGSKAETKHFLQKLPYEKRAFYSFRVVSHNDRALNPSHFPTADNLCYLFSQMSSEQQLQALRISPFFVLKRFLEWPWQDLFLDIADVIWTFLPESRYDFLLSLIYANVRNSGFHFPYFIQELFLRSPNNFRKHFVREYKSFFSEFFNAEDTETIRVIFRTLDVEDRMGLVFGYHFFQVLDNALMTDKWNLIKLCLQEASLSKEEMKRLKETFMEFLTGDDSRGTRLRRRKWRMFFRFLDETDANSLNKRSREDERLTKVKKLCSEKNILPKI